MAALNINRQQLDNLLKGDKPVLVDFWAPWCGYCRRINPVYDKIAQQYADSMEIVKINIDEEEQLADQLGVEVIPTLIIFAEGKIADKVVNPASKAAIDEFIAKNIV